MCALFRWARCHQFNDFHTVPVARKWGPVCLGIRISKALFGESKSTRWAYVLSSTRVIGLGSGIFRDFILRLTGSWPQRFGLLHGGSGRISVCKGFNVITVLLPGHGTGNVGCHRRAVARGSGSGSGHGIAGGTEDHPGGFSLGAALAIDALLRHREIYGLVLFSPAIRLRSFASISTLACAPVVRSYVLETDLPPNPVKYKYRVGNSVWQLSRLMEHNLRAGDTGAVTVSEDQRVRCSPMAGSSGRSPTRVCPIPTWYVVRTPITARKTPVSTVWPPC